MVDLAGMLLLSWSTSLFLLSLPPLIRVMSIIVPLITILYMVSQYVTTSIPSLQGGPWTRWRREMVHPLCCLIHLLRVQGGFDLLYVYIYTHNFNLVSSTNKENQSYTWSSTPTSICAPNSKGSSPGSFDNSSYYDHSISHSVTWLSEYQSVSATLRGNI